MPEIQSVQFKDDDLIISNDFVSINGKKTFYLGLSEEDLQMVKSKIEPFFSQKFYEEDKYGLYFLLFKVYFQRKYENKEQEVAKFEIFRKNLNLINAANKRNASFLTQINKFADSQEKPGMMKLPLPPSNPPKNKMFPKEGFKPNSKENDLISIQINDESTSLNSLLENELSQASESGGVFSNSKVPLQKAEPAFSGDEYHLDNIINRRVREIIASLYYESLNNKRKQPQTIKSSMLHEFPETFPLSLEEVRNEEVKKEQIFPKKELEKENKPMLSEFPNDNQEIEVKYPAILVLRPDKITIIKDFSE